MKTSKFYIAIFILTSVILLLANSCKREKAEEEIAPEIILKSGGIYTSHDATVNVNDLVTIGIEAAVHEEKDPLVRFNISKSEDGGASQDVYTESLNDETFEFDFEVLIDSSMLGRDVEYTFSVTNRDGLTGQQKLTLTIE